MIGVNAMDVFYISYDEPQKGSFAEKIQEAIPNLKRIDEIEGEMNALVACASQSNTNQFIVIDGDTLPDMGFFNQEIDESILTKNTLRWRSRNNFNGVLGYSGGLRIINRFGVMLPEKRMHDCYSVTYPTESEFHAWRSGFRAGVKLSLVDGEKVLTDKFKTAVQQKLMDELTIWHNVGMDAKHGIYALLGARMGTFRCMLTDWDHKLVDDYSALKDIWDNEVSTFPESTIYPFMIQLGGELSANLDLPVTALGEDESAFFKYHYTSGRFNLGIDVEAI